MKHACRACCGTGIDQIWASSAASRLRSAAGIGVREMARRLGMTPSYVSDLEKSRRAWNHELLGRWLAECAKETP